MKTLITYATYSGATQMASQILFDEIKKTHSTDYKNITELKSGRLNNYELSIMCSPTWDFDGQEGMPHEDYITTFEKLKNDSLESKKFAVMGLGDSSYNIFCGCVAHIEKFIQDHKGKLIVPSLKIDGFFYNQNDATTNILKWANELLKSTT